MIRVVISFFLIYVIGGCANTEYIMTSPQFHFQSEINEIALKDIIIELRSESGIEYFINSNDFSTCPIDNDTCRGRRYYSEIDKYTHNVPMTDVYEYSVADGKIEIAISIQKNELKNELLRTSLVEDRRIRGDVLIHFGYGYDINNERIANFIKVVRGAFDEDLPKHITVPITTTEDPQDSLSLVWFLH